MGCFIEDLSLNVQSYLDLFYMELALNGKE